MAYKFPAGTKSIRNLTPKLLYDEKYVQYERRRLRKDCDDPNDKYKCMRGLLL